MCGRSVGQGGARHLPSPPPQAILSGPDLTLPSITPTLHCLGHRRTGAGQREQALTLPRDQACQIPACAQRPQPTQGAFRAPITPPACPEALSAGPASSL